MKNKFPFSALLVAAGMKVLSVVLKAFASLLGKIKFISGIANLLKLCSTVCNVGFWILLLFFAFRVATFVFSKIRKGAVDTKLQIARDNAQIAKDKEELNLVRQEEAETNRYEGRQARGF